LPDLDSVPGLVEDLDKFVGAFPAARLDDFMDRSEFRMEDYRATILAAIEEGCTVFNRLPRIADDTRLDRTRRFISLIFMWQEREVELSQYGTDILVEKHETDVEG